MIIFQKDCYTLSLSHPASPVMTFAAEELERYLHCALQMKRGKGVDIALRWDPSLGERERISLDFKKGITIAGSNERSVLYGVYEFLERYVGCCFGAMAHPDRNIGEMIPKLESLSLPEEGYDHTADLPYRTAIVQFDVWAGEADRGLTLPFFDWLAKNRYNRLLLWVSCYEKLKAMGLEEELYKRGFSLTVGHHQATFTFLPPYGSAQFPTAYRTAHPAYFRMLPDGGRFIPDEQKLYNGQWLLCSRNEECVEAVAANILCWLEKNPLVDTIAFWPNDGSDDDCCCSACAPYTKTENYLHFNSALAARMAKERPDIRIDTLIYMDLWDCPKGIRLSDHLLIDMAMCTQNFRPYGKRDGGNLLGTEYEENLLAYRAIAKNVVAYEYYMGNYGNAQRVVPAADEMQSIFAALKARGMSGSGTQIECFNHWNNLFNFYCFARTAFDIGLSVEQQMERFAHLFGKGGAKIKELLSLYEQTYEGQVSIHQGGKYLIEQIDTDRVYALFEEALAIEEDPRARNNIRMMRMAFRYSHLAVTDSVSLKGIKTKVFEDPTGELAYMATHFDSYLANHMGYGIAIPLANRTDAAPPNQWYIFE